LQDREDMEAPRMRAGLLPERIVEAEAAAGQASARAE